MNRAIGSRGWLCGFACVSLLAVPLAAAQQAPQLPLPYETFGGNAWTVADLDGDGRPDVVTARPEVRGDRFRHRVEVQLSSAAGRVVTFAVDNMQPGISVSARDVDGDHDIDLVLTTAVSHQSVGVWINDGAGSFARASVAESSAPPAAMAAGDSFSDSARHATEPLLLPPSPPAAALASSPDARRPEQSEPLLRERERARTDASLSALRPRAPPAFL